MSEKRACDILSAPDRLLFLAARDNFPETIEALISEGARPWVQRESDKYTPLMISAWHGHLENVKVLIKKGAIINVLNKDGASALSCAAQQGHLEIVKYLLKRGADIQVTDKDGDTPLSAARKANKQAVVEYLEKYMT